MVDNGIGIQKSDRSKIFKLFGCIKDEKNHINTKGIGLGLVISQMIVNKFDGNIDFKSKIGKGTNFYFTFELSENNADKFELNRIDTSYNLDSMKKRPIKKNSFENSTYQSKAYGILKNQNKLM